MAYCAKCLKGIVTQPEYDNDLMLCSECRGDTIQVVSKHWYHSEGDYIGRPSPLGNPFSHKDGTLAQFKTDTVQEAIEKYHEWLREQWRLNAPAKRELIRLVYKYKRESELTLICWCAPNPCHGDVLRDAILKIAGG